MTFAIANQSVGDIVFISVMCVVLLCFCVNHMCKNTSDDEQLPVYNLPTLPVYSVNPPPDPTLPKYVDIQIK